MLWSIEQYRFLSFFCRLPPKQAELCDWTRPQQILFVIKRSFYNYLFIAAGIPASSSPHRARLWLWWYNLTRSGWNAAQGGWERKNRSCEPSQFWVGCFIPKSQIATLDIPNRSNFERVALFLSQNCDPCRQHKKRASTVCLLSVPWNIGRAVYPTYQVPFRVRREPFRSSIFQNNDTLFVISLYPFCRHCQWFFRSLPLFSLDSILYSLMG